MIGDGCWCTIAGGFRSGDRNSCTIRDRGVCSRLETEVGSLLWIEVNGRSRIDVGAADWGWGRKQRFLLVEAGSCPVDRSEQLSFTTFHSR